MFGTPFITLIFIISAVGVLSLIIQRSWSSTVAAICLALDAVLSFVALIGGGR